jgi:membrane associated rhomboid family serine protease
MSDAVRNPDDYCYRHPDRLSFVLCEGCGRTICLECQTHVGGKVLCPDDARRSNVTMLPVNARPKRVRRVRQPSRLFSWVTDVTPIVTYSVLALLVILFLADVFTRGLVSQHLSVFPSSYGVAVGADVLHQPWSLLTSALMAGGIIGLLFNGYTIFVLGRQLERLFGRRKFAVLYGVSGLGASVLAFLLDGYVSSAIGAVFGLVAATVVVGRRMGGNLILLYVTCAISLVFAILFGSWQAAIGGGLAGLATAFTYLYDDGSARHRRARLLLAALVALLIVVAAVRAVVLGG